MAPPWLGNGLVGACRPRYPCHGGAFDAADTQPDVAYPARPIFIMEKGSISGPACLHLSISLQNSA